MLKFVQHPRCSDIKILASEVIRRKKHKHIVIIAKYDGIISNNTKILLKKVQSRSYSRVMYLLSFIPDNKERSYFLQTFNSVSIYVQNNHDVNVVKLWVNSIFIQKRPKKNSLVTLGQRSQNFQFYSYLRIELGFTPKIIIRKKV